MRLGINTFPSKKAFLPVIYILWKYISCRSVPLLIVSNPTLNPIKSTGKFPVPTYQSFMNELRNNLSIPAVITLVMNKKNTRNINPAILILSYEILFFNIRTLKKFTY